MRIAGIVLAAGRSARMGGATNKLVEEVAGRPLVAWPVDAMLEAGLDPVLVVLGFEASRVREALAGRRCIFVEHAAWAEGMGSSLAWGIRALSSHSDAIDAVAVSVGDLPGLRRHHVTAVVAACVPEAARACSVVPTCRGRNGHPVLFGRSSWDELARLTGDQGGRTVLAARPERVVRIAIDDDAILADVDTPEALDRARGQSADRGAAR